MSNTHPGFVGVTPVYHTVSTTERTKGGVSCHVICANPRSSADLSTSLFSSLSVEGPSTCLNIAKRGRSRITTSVVLTFRQRLSKRPTRIMLIMSSVATAVDYSVITGGHKLGITRIVTNAHSFSVGVPHRIGHAVISTVSSCLFATNVITGHGLGRRNVVPRCVRCINGVLVSAVHFGHRHLIRPV